MLSTSSPTVYNKAISFLFILLFLIKLLTAINCAANIDFVSQAPRPYILLFLISAGPKYGGTVSICELINILAVFGSVPVGYDNTLYRFESATNCNSTIKSLASNQDFKANAI